MFLGILDAKVIDVGETCKDGSWRVIVYNDMMRSIVIYNHIGT
jgi:hypothetical protein